MFKIKAKIPARQSPAAKQRVNKDCGSSQAIRLINYDDDGNLEQTDKKQWQQPSQSQHTAIRKKKQKNSINRQLVQQETTYRRWKVNLKEI